MSPLESVIRDFSSARVLVLGDLMLDRYTWGDTNRVSPEAPVLVLEADEEEIRLGGAGSVAMLARGLGARVSAAGVVGDDASGRVVQRLLRELGVDQNAVVVDEDRLTDLPPFSVPGVMRVWVG